MERIKNMEKDQLERFVKENRNAFDKLEPSKSVWDRIEQDINKPKGNTGTLVYWLLGVIVVLIACVSLLIGMQMGKPKTIEPVYFANQQQYDEFRETEQFYTKMVDFQLSQMGDTPESQQVRSDIEQLDEVYQELKEELLSSPSSNNELIINLMINNYKTKIEILERVLMKSNEKDNSTIKENIFNDETINL